MTLYKKRCVSIDIVLFVKWYSGEIFNQLWEHNQLKVQENITDVPHKAYYNCSDEEQYIKDSGLDVFNPNPIFNFFKNLYISDVDLEQTLIKIRHIEIETKAEEQEKKLLDLFPHVRPQYPDELLPQLLDSNFFRFDQITRRLQFVKIQIFLILASNFDASIKLDSFINMVKNRIDQQ